MAEHTPSSQTSVYAPGRTMDSGSVSLYRRMLGGIPWYFWWLAPAVAILATITIFPFFWMIYMSFMKIQLQPGFGNLFVGLANWIKMFRDPNISHGWMLLAIYIFACMVLQMGLGLGIALLINNMKGESFFSRIFLIPMMVAPVVVGHLFNQLHGAPPGYRLRSCRNDDPRCET